MEGRRPSVRFIVYGSFGTVRSESQAVRSRTNERNNTLLTANGQLGIFARDAGSIKKRADMESAPGFGCSGMIIALFLPDVQQNRLIGINSQQPRLF